MKVLTERSALPQELTCDQCKEVATAVAVVGEESDLYSSTATLCKDCLQSAILAITQHTG